MAIKILLIILSLIYISAKAQKKWAGIVAGNWEDAQSWQPQGVPATTDDVILDNTYQVNNYTITIANAAANVHTLSLEPIAGNNIEVVIAASNKSSPALIINDTVNCFNIKSGGVFKNSSGLSSGQSIQIGGMISIFNGGRYIHNSRSSHATEIVARLSAATGTEKGIFEFDVPGGSYPISISNRVYGTLILSAVASGGTQTYNASGSNPVLINGDFVINDGVQFNLDLTRDMIVNTDFIQKGGVFNVASQPNNNTIKIKGDVTQFPLAVITETSGGLPVVELCGVRRQLVSFAGSLINSVCLKVNNQQGIALTGSLLLPFKLELTAGAIKTSRSTMLTLADNCIATGGSVNSFIDGPVKKVGDDDFEFPVGKQGDYAPVKITGSGGSITDEFVGEYFLGSPAQAYGYNFETPPMVRISGQEYWVLERLSGSSIKKVGVSVGNYSNATALANLVLARWDVGANLWKNEGNSFYSGIATGTLVSNDVNLFGAFTLGSTVVMQNPLPLDSFRVRSATVQQSPVVHLRVFPSVGVDNFHLQLQMTQNDIVTVVVSDMGGKRFKGFRIGLSKGFNDTTLELGHLAKGAYVLCLYDGMGRCFGCRKLIKI